MKGDNMEEVKAETKTESEDKLKDAVKVFNDNFVCGLFVGVTKENRLMVERIGNSYNELLAVGLVELLKKQVNDAVKVQLGNPELEAIVSLDRSVNNLMKLVIDKTAEKN